MLDDYKLEQQLQGLSTGFQNTSNYPTTIII